MSRKNDEGKSRKRNVISELIELYDIKSAEDIQDALKDLLGETIEDMLISELSEHLGYNEYERNSNTNSRNGKKTKILRSKYGEIPISVPQDRESTFEPKIVSKRHIRNRRKNNINVCKRLINKTDIRANRRYIRI